MSYSLNVVTGDKRVFFSSSGSISQLVPNLKAETPPVFTQFPSQKNVSVDFIYMYVYFLFEAISPRSLHSGIVHLL